MPPPQLAHLFCQHARFELGRCSPNQHQRGANEHGYDHHSKDPKCAHRLGQTFVEHNAKGTSHFTQIK